MAISVPAFAEPVTIDKYKVLYDSLSELETLYSQMEKVRHTDGYYLIPYDIGKMTKVPRSSYNPLAMADEWRDNPLFQNYASKFEELAKFVYDNFAFYSPDKISYPEDELKFNEYRSTMRRELWWMCPSQQIASGDITLDMLRGVKEEDIVSLILENPRSRMPYNVSPYVRLLKDMNEVGDDAYFAERPWFQSGYGGDGWVFKTEKDFIAMRDNLLQYDHRGVYKALLDYKRAHRATIAHLYTKDGRLLSDFQKRNHTAVYL